ncbi:MAG: SIR2 family protein [candidate division WOR-3 bacterium]|nr:SIR2 family protein [candidate division WOR-3 bacterium]
MAPSVRKPASFEDRLLAKLREQVRGRRTGFLLGAGASFLGGAGYPLARSLWPAIKGKMTAGDRLRIEQRLTRGAENLEQALGALDRGKGDPAIRHRVTAAIAAAFRSRRPPLDHHRQFISRLAGRNERRVPVFTLNYDPLLELAADAEQKYLADGFSGTIQAYLHPVSFSDYRGSYELRRNRTVIAPLRGIINLYKLHGSLGWYLDQQESARRIRPDMRCPDGWSRLMIPPQNRKAADTGNAPYALIWSEFRAHLTNDCSRLLNRLVCAGYGFGDEHVNAIINPALARRNFTLVVLAKSLPDGPFKFLLSHDNVLVATETRSSLYGEEGPGMANAWSFEWLTGEV